MSSIPGLPIELEEVPMAPSSPDDPDAGAKRQAWLDWREQVRRYRIERISDCMPDTGIARELRALELEKCRRSPAYFLTVWGWLYEPRAEQPGEDEIPFIPFAAQVDLLQFFENCMNATGAEADGLVSKSRDMGASWLMCGFFLHGWLFKRPWKILLMSRNEKLVDARDANSLFWKIDWIFNRLPLWMIPKGYRPDEHRMKLLMINPDNGNQIGGESTTVNAGRGGRMTAVGGDEWAFIDDAEETYDSMANSTYHRLIVSSESNKKGPGFINIRKGIGRPRVPAVAELDWWVHPLHDQAWYEDIKSRMDYETFAQEVLRDPYDGNSSWVYPVAMQKQVVEREYVPGYPLYVGIDPGFSDETALVWAYDNLISGEFVILDAYYNKRMPADYYGTILAGRQETGPWDYDEEALRLIRWVERIDGSKAQFFGDTYGDQVNGTTMDSFYSRLRKFGIHVNVDRLPSGQISAYQDEARQHQGRRAALRDLLPRMTFANTPGAKWVLEALQQNRFRPTDKPTQYEAKSPLHDWTSHPVTAVEFVAVNLRIRRSAAARSLNQPARLPTKPPLPRNTVRLGQRNQPRWSTR